MKPKYHDMFDFQTKNGWKSEAETGKHECCQSRVLPDTEQMGFKCTAVNSGKAANYLPGFCKQEVVFGTIDELLEMIS